MSPEEILVLTELVRRRSGVVIDPEKAYLVESRLAPVARREGFASIREMILAIASHREERLIWAAVEAMANTETMFFRDRSPFEHFRSDILPVLAARGGLIRLCSLGCSTGQEAYSLAMLMEEERDRFPHAKADILACDLSERCLEKAQSGLYTQFEVQRGLPSRLLIKYFERNEETWALSPRMRQQVRWRRVNLMNDLRALGQFDAVFCRNVLSSFDEPTRKRVLEQIALALPEEGFLILGLNETALGITEAFRPVSGRRGLYQRNPAFRVAA
jgi:chemotaxis protein methyltransferase CheR